MTRKPIFPTPPPSLLGRCDGRGGSGRGRPTCRAGGGGGVNPTSMAQNDTHVALIILTTQMWGGKLLVEKTFSGQIFCVPVPLAPTSVLTQNKGPDTEPHFSNPPLPLLRRASMSPLPPPPQSNFQVAQCHNHLVYTHSLVSVPGQCRHSIQRSPIGRWGMEKAWNIFLLDAPLDTLFCTPLRSSWQPPSLLFINSFTSLRHSLN